MTSLLVEFVNVMGYPFVKKGWSLFDLEKKVFVSRDVKFYENVFPFFFLMLKRKLFMLWTIIILKYLLMIWRMLKVGMS